MGGTNPRGGNHGGASVIVVLVIYTYIHYIIYVYEYVYVYTSWNGTDDDGNEGWLVASDDDVRTVRVRGTNESIINSILYYIHPSLSTHGTNYGTVRTLSTKTMC